MGIFNQQKQPTLPSMFPKAEMPQSFPGSVTPLSQQQLFSYGENDWKTPGAISTGSNPWDFVYSRNETGTGTSNISSIPRWLYDLGARQDLAVTDAGGALPMGFSTRSGGGSGLFDTGKVDYYYTGTDPGRVQNGDDFQRSGTFDPNSWTRTKLTPLLIEAQRTGNWALLNGTPYDVLGPSGEVTGQRMFQNLGQEDNIDQMVGFAAAALATAGAAGWLGGGAGAGEAAGAGAFDTAGFEGLSSGLAGVPPPANPFTLSSYLNPTNLMNAIKSPMGLEKLFSNPITRKIATSAITSGLGGGGSSRASGGSSGGGMASMFDNLFGGGAGGDLVNILGGLYGSNQQGKAADRMLSWMDEQNNYVRNYGNPGTPENSYLKDVLERQDAAAGRNSQYGPRTTELLGKLGEAKLNASSRMALGMAPAYAKAINQDANKYAGLPAALNKALGGGGGLLQSGSTLGSILNKLGAGGSTLSNDQFWDMVGPEGTPAGMPYDPTQMPTEEDIFDFLDGFGDFGGSGGFDALGSSFGGGGLMDDLMDFGVF